MTSNKPIGVLYGFRAIMVLLVCNFHIWQQSWMLQGFTLFGQFVSTDYITRSSYLFVDGMILLSGFLLFLPHARSMLSGAPVPSAKAFYKNRALRIIPSYLFAVVVLLILANGDRVYFTGEQRTLDVLTHLTFTFNLRADTCLYTPLGTALWTVAVEVQFYLIFPLLAKAARKKPVMTLGLMAAVGIAFRLIVGCRLQSDALLINQMPAFLDVYALGFLGALGYVWMEKQDFGKSRAKQGLLALVFALCVWLILTLLAAQSAQSTISQERLRQSQLEMRLPFAFAILMAMLSASFMPKALRWLLDNRLMRFLATISYGLYICHQSIAARLSRYTFPSSLHMDEDLQIAFTLLCFSLSIVVAMLTTFGIEKPTVSLANTLTNRFGRKNHERPKTAKTEQPAG